MLLITQLIYIIDGQEKVFDEFESIAIPTILKYNGRLLLREIGCKIMLRIVKWVG